MSTKTKQLDGIDKYNREQIANMKVLQSGGNVLLTHRELREVLFRFKPDSKILISTDLFYKLLVGQGIHVPGFSPNKTRLRQYGMSIENINKILPGSFNSLEGDGRRRNGGSNV